jgi:hypothetical protein
MPNMNLKILAVNFGDRESMHFCLLRKVYLAKLPNSFQGVIDPSYPVSPA